MYIVYINTFFCFYLQDLATEIIMTLGQAFEIAYKMLLKTQQQQQPLRANRIQAMADEDESDTASYEDTKL